MRGSEIYESASQQKLLALSQFLSGRASDENSIKQISIDAFVQAARSLGIELNRQNLPDLMSQPPLNNILEPLEPNSEVVRFKGDAKSVTGMSVDQARAVVDSNAKAAMKRRQ